MNFKSDFVLKSKKINIAILCDKINLQPEIKSRVLDFSNNFDFSIVDKQLKNFQNYEKMFKSLNELQILLGKDLDNIKILSCMLKASVDIYDIYLKKNISDEIYFDTMKCYTRFIDETFKVTGKMYFDRYWWTVHQAGGHLFRIGELEYSLENINRNFSIGIHIPSDANLSPDSVYFSIKKAKIFFRKHYPELSNYSFVCHSWLMDTQLQKMLDEKSNIVNFQKRFEIFNEGEVSIDFIGWIYYTESSDYLSLPENTSLQKNVKNHILSGGVIRNSYGKLKEFGDE